MAFEMAGRAKSTAHQLLHHLGVEIRRKPRPLIRSDNELRMTLEFVLAHLAARHEGPIRIVQVGAFDGVANDPILDALNRFDCRAVLVEPQAGPFERLAALHASREDIQLVNAALDREDGIRDMYVVEPLGMPDWVGQLASFNRPTIEAHQRFLPPDQPIPIKATPVRTTTFDTLIQSAGFDRVDVLQVDTEGYDLELLRMFDIPRRLPAVVNWEHTHLSRSDREAAVELLIGNGYSVAMSDETFGDSVAYHHPSST